MTQESRSPQPEISRLIRGLWLACLCLFTCCTQAAHSDETAIQNFLSRYFSTWSANDMEGYGSCFHPTARITFVQSGANAGSQGLTDFLHGQKLGHQQSPTPMTEVPTSMKISGDSRVAQAEVRWKLSKGRETITGTDYFTLIKTEAGWKIAALVFYND
jgi:hypothetical protein